MGGPAHLAGVLGERVGDTSQVLQGEVKERLSGGSSHGSESGSATRCGLRTHRGGTRKSAQNRCINDYSAITALQHTARTLQQNRRLLNTDYSSSSPSRRAIVSAASPASSSVHGSTGVPCTQNWRDTSSTSRLVLTLAMFTSRCAITTTPTVALSRTSNGPKVHVVSRDAQNRVTALRKAGGKGRGVSSACAGDGGAAGDVRGGGRLRQSAAHTRQHR